VASRTHAQPYETPFFRLFFSDPLHMKAWLTTAALLLGLDQLLTAARIYGSYVSRQSWALLMAGGVLFAILMVLWLTSAFWLSGALGVGL
jgi:hypothetical protein